MLESRLQQPQVGACTTHGIMVEVNGIPRCLMCDNANKGSGLVVRKFGGVTPEELEQLQQIIPNEGAEPPVGGLTVQPLISAGAKAYKPAIARQPTGDPVSSALILLSQVPAPKDLKAYKKLVKAINLLEELKANGTA